MHAAAVLRQRTACPYLWFTRGRRCDIPFLATTHLKAPTPALHARPAHPRPAPPSFLAGVAHRDIKLENLLLHWDKGAEQPLLKLCDFGYSQLQGSKAGKAAVGTLGYMAPEVFK
jgi:serine/threonine protein kinase